MNELHSVCCEYLQKLDYVILWNIIIKQSVITQLCILLAWWQTMVSPTRLCWRYHSLPLNQWSSVTITSAANRSYFELTKTLHFSPSWVSQFVSTLYFGENYHVIKWLDCMKTQLLEQGFMLDFPSPQPEVWWSPLESLIDPLPWGHRHISDAQGYWQCMLAGDTQ